MFCLRIWLLMINIFTGFSPFGSPQFDRSATFSKPLEVNIETNPRIEVVMRQSQRERNSSETGRVGSGQFFVARVGPGQPFMVWVWKIFPKNVKFFNFFPFGSKYLFGLG